ncbi:non-homologous end-joining DNA ligase [Streptomyces sp. NPDC026672]|uniref:non-homologous end-joining DNA ligase n=1 Tax=unclassified Streptomyces TaxID=2593676 RepID=UPI0033D2969E
MTPITEVEGRRVALSNLDKVLYPATGFTKGELLHYYATVADVLLPHLRDRPVSFLRYPDGAEGEVFFTKNVPPGTPEWVMTADVRRAEGPARMVVVRDLASLMWAANLVTEFHVPQWVVGEAGAAGAADAGRLDRLVFDLDPGAPATVVECCEVALWLRERLREDGIEAFVKTSGVKGLHVVAAVRGTSERASEYAKGVAVEAEGALPGLVVHRMTRSLRVGKVFVDWSQNAARKTTAVAYTVRAQGVPAVSTPVSWAEVEGCRGAGDLVFVAGDVVERVREGGDLLGAMVAGAGVELP